MTLFYSVKIKIFPYGFIELVILLTFQTVFLTQFRVFNETLVRIELTTTVLGRD